MSRISAQNNSTNMYDKDWTAVTALENEGKMQDALSKVQDILKQAKTDNNNAQIIKANLYKYKYKQTLEEDAEWKIVNEINTDIENSKDIEKAILHSIQAELLYQYYQNNSWKFINRTQTEEIQSNDFRTWDLKTLFNEISKHYVASLEPKQILQTTGTETIKSLLTNINYNNVDKKEFIDKNLNLRPTIYDLLAHRAIDFFNNDNSDLTEPANAFAIDNEIYFSTATNFVQLPIQAENSNDRLSNAMHIFQDLLKFRLADKNNLDALADADRKRLQFVRDHYFDKDKNNDLYFEAQQRIANEYKNTTIAALIQSEVARTIYNKAQENKENNPYTATQALDLCEATIKQYPNTFGSYNCQALIEEIKAKALSINVAEVLPINTTDKLFVSYKNINKIYLKWAKINFNDKDKIFEKNYKDPEDIVLQRLNKIAATNSWQQNIPNPEDYKNHSVEVQLNTPKNNGYFVLMVANNPEFAIKGNEQAVAVVPMFISDISFTTQKEEESKINVFVVDRKSGYPLKEAKVSIYEKKYDYDKRKYIKTEIANIITDKNGFASQTIFSNETKNYYNSKSIFFDICYKEDFLSSDNSVYLYKYKENAPLKTEKANIFTDRAIYRPGQIIYFKGICYSTLDGNNELLKDKTVKVVFYDANQQKIAEQDLVTNQFGSITGTFTAPTTGMLGSMTIKALNEWHSIRVEEYKRPKFEVDFDTIKSSYNVYDTVAIKGFAKSYSGAMVDGAKVTYTIKRKTQMPIWYWWSWRRPWFNQEEKIITTGTTTTDENGSYTIQFVAEPDLSVAKKHAPYFNYEIIVDVTDINGETRSNTTTVKVGYLAIDAFVDLPENLSIDKDNIIQVKTNNLNGYAEPTDVKITIQELKAPNNPKEKRYWEQPDQFLLTQAEHDKIYPYQIYKDENLYENYEVLKTVKSYAFNTGNQTAINILKDELPAGIYKLNFSCLDKSGQEIKFSKAFVVSNPNATTLNPKDFISVTLNKTTVQPNEVLTYKIGTSLQKAYIVAIVKMDDKLLAEHHLYLNNEIKTFSIPTIKEEDRGKKIEIVYYMIFNNRYYAGKEAAYIPYKSNQLQVEWKTFRDKLLPGQKESWELTIKGPEKEKVNAELLAAMYDASLDEFASNSFNLYLPYKYNNYNLNAFSGFDFGSISGSLYTSDDFRKYTSFLSYYYQNLNLYGLTLNQWNRYNIYYKSAAGNGYALKEAAKMNIQVEENEMALEEAVPTTAPPPSAIEKDEDGVQDKNFGDVENKPKQEEPIPNIRTNLNETAFFFPQLKTNEAGDVVFSFTMPEALTKWKFLGLAHTEDLKYISFENSTITQKDLMVVPNGPRFMRQGDMLTLTAKVTNLSDTVLNGFAYLNIKNALTNETINQQFAIKNNRFEFSVKPNQNTLVQWQIRVPENIDAIVYEISAKAGNFTDGEANTIPVLSNRILVTESLPLWITGKSTKKYTLDKLANNTSTTLTNQKYTLEMSSNPAWYAVQALPYLMEYPYECAEQLFSRYYANTLASYIANSNPRIQNVFNKWKETNSEALLSNLEKNQELKNVLLEESPWVREAQDETEQKKRIALLFDLDKMSKEQAEAFNKLKNLQSSNGGFYWFKGMPENRYITQYIMEGIGHLSKLNVLDITKSDDLSSMTKKAVLYLDDRMKEDFEDIKKYDKNYLTSNHLSNMVIHYLYMRSFYNNIEIKKQNKEAYDYFFGQAKKYWNANLNDYYMQAMLGMVLYRNNEATLANKIITSFKQTAIHSEEMGMYWKAVENPGWYWYQAPVETQSIIIEFFNEVAKDQKAVDELKVWLLKQKQTTSWKTTKATAEACYALLLSGSNWINNNKLVEVKVGNEKFDESNVQLGVEAGTGYYKMSWNADQIKPEMANITLKKTDDGPAWGAVYWQYFEDLDKITGAKTNLQLTKKYFKKVTTNEGTILKEITDNSPIKVGDLITVRIELRTDRNLEYVHLKDLRAAGMEPTNVLSQYKWQDGLGYYETTKDVATHFFVDWMNKGIYVFEYDLRANIAGTFSSGITSIECMYAPEFKSHSNGITQTIQP
ncbi:MAG: alpha-2-macroglobulin [Chitinophagales bacterium]|nr:alpha-2-macroglobulin [Chitinophagales bacterium]